MIKLTRLCVSLLAAAVLCSACGYRGALYYPSDAPPAPKPSVIAPTQ